MKHKNPKFAKCIIQLFAFVMFTESFALSLFALKRVVGAVTAALSGSGDVWRGFPWNSVGSSLVILLGTLLAVVFCGRYYCGYLCGFGAMQDLLGWIGGKLIKKDVKVLKRLDKALSMIRFVVLAVLTLGVVFDLPIPGGPWTVWGQVINWKGQSNLNAFLSLGGLILLLILAGSVVLYRPFCRYLCPMGAVYSLCSFLSYDRRHRTCGNSGDCCICPYQCKKRKISHLGLAITIVLFFAANVLYSYWPMYLNSDNSSSIGDTVSEQNSIIHPYQDGSYTGTGEGFRGSMTVTVTVENGRICDINVDTCQDDEAYMDMVISELVPSIMNQQSCDVDVVTGATYSSKGLLEAVTQALGLDEGLDKSYESDKSDESDESDKGEKRTDLSDLPDGTYEGSGIGFRGEIAVSVTVSDGKISKIQILTYYDNEEYLFHAAPVIFEEIIDAQSLTVDAVTGATYSCNGLVKAVADALNVHEDSYQLSEERPRSQKNKKGHHITQKTISSEEEYEELVEKYKNLSFSPDGKKQ